MNHNSHMLSLDATRPTLINGPTHKVIVVGDSSIGKTCLIWRATTGKFTENWNRVSTRELFYNSVEHNSRLELWDASPGS